MIINDLYNNNVPVLAEGMQKWLVTHSGSRGESGKDIIEAPDFDTAWKLANEYDLDIIDVKPYMGPARPTLVDKGVAEGSDQQWVVTVGTKTGGTSHTMTFSGTKEQAIKQAVARFGTSKNPVVTAKPKQQGVAEGMSDDMAAMAQKKFPNAYISKDGEEVQKPVNWGKRYTPPAAPPADLEKRQRDLTAKYPNIDELVRRAELNRDPNYEMADGQAYYNGREAEQNYLKLKQIQRVIQGLNESLQRTQP
jgi:hypothetical protein